MSHPSLSSVSEDAVLLFLQELKVYQSCTPKEEQISVSILLDPFLLESLCLEDPKLGTSDKHLPSFLETLIVYDNYEEYHHDDSRITMDTVIPEVRERCSQYLRRFLKIRMRASGLGIPDSAFMNMYANGVLPLGLPSSLLTRLEDGLYKDFNSLVQEVLDEPLELARSMSWIKTSREARNTYSTNPTVNKEEHTLINRMRTRSSNVESKY
ncbi:hypothetical protein RCL1_002888 [Eukaryota sp. TZLM3-RCL]